MVSIELHQNKTFRRRGGTEKNTTNKIIVIYRNILGNHFIPIIRMQYLLGMSIKKIIVKLQSNIYIILTKKLFKLFMSVEYTVIINLTYIYL